MVSPSYMDRICAMFDSFCKTVSRNYYRDLLRAEKCRNDHYKEEPVDYLFELLGHKDAYPSDSFVLDADGHSCVVESETLYEALKSLPDDQRKVILYDFWLELKDREIAERLEVTVRTVYNLRRRAFKRIKSYYELHGQGRDP